MSGLQLWSPAWDLPSSRLTVRLPNPIHDVLASTLLSEESHRVYLAWPRRSVVL
jgi:hypothetical protein